MGAGQEISRRSFLKGAAAAVGVGVAGAGVGMAAFRPGEAPRSSEAAATGVEITSISSSPSKLAFVYAEGGKSYAATAQLVKGNVEAIRLPVPSDFGEAKSVGISKDTQTVVVGGMEKIIKSIDGGKTWKTFKLPDEFDFVSQVVPVETIDQNPNRPVVVVAFNHKIGNPNLIMIYPDGAIIPVTEGLFGGPATGIREEGGKYVSFGASPFEHFYSRYEISRTGNTATIAEKKVQMAPGVEVSIDGFEVFDKGQREFWISKSEQYLDGEGEEDGVFIDPLHSTKSFMARRALFPELAGDVYRYSNELTGLVKLDDATSAYVLIQTRFTSSTTAGYFVSLLKFDSASGNFIRKIPIEFPDSLRGWGINDPMILQSGTDRSLVVLGGGQSRILVSPFNETGMTVQQLSGVKVLQAPITTKAFLPVTIKQ